MKGAPSLRKRMDLVAVLHIRPRIVTAIFSMSRGWVWVARVP